MSKRFGSSNASSSSMDRDRNLSVVMEAVEARILFSTVPYGMTGEQAGGTLKDANGNIMGSATLENGLLTVNGTSADEEITLGTSWNDSSKLNVRISRRDGRNFLQSNSTYNLSAIIGVVLNAQGGNDYLDFLSFNRALDIPTTLNGGAGDDWIECNGVAYGENDPEEIVDTTQIGTVVHGGAGNDLIFSSLLRSDQIDAGDGDDMIETAIGYTKDRIIPSAGHDILRVASIYGDVDIPLNPIPDDPIVQPTGTTQSGSISAPEPAATEPTSSPLVAIAPTTKSLATPFASNTLLVSNHKLWDV